MRNFLITVVIFGVVLAAGFYMNKHFAPVPSLERQIPKLDPSFQRFVHLESHEDKDIGIYMTEQERIKISLLEPSVSKDAQVIGGLTLPSHHGSTMISQTFQHSTDHFLFGMIGNSSITQVYVNGSPCDTLHLDDTALWYCFFDESPASVEIQGMDASGSIRYRSSHGE